ncbi:Similar to hypothetical protein [Tuber melanosporum Mel28]; acc. no. XP_002841114 [Pyronema omphalodes CBS 100304]|uniref:Uncharacterized protein n=1 Tax=Pyronema omphalodes (strain CBS 100304) TaxID=1076935 RepID=U4LAU5_PYROM|nr:Similar to hypothetical protein [Tuber melanosporum Mel28]; acc. no. XP_002841114 [Pyronema omphalodes CBS 100304]
MAGRSEDSDGMGDSYEILTDSTIMSDEDDDGTSSIASLDDDMSDAGLSSMAASTDSLRSIPENDSEDEDDHPNPIPSFAGLDEHHLDDSMHTLLDRSPSPEEFLFDEPEEVTGNEIQVSQKLSVFKDAEATEIRRSLRLDDNVNVYSTVRQSMSRDLLQLQEPFRVLYVGSTVAKEEIQHKLASALAAALSESTSSTGSWDSIKSPRFNIVPINSFGSLSTSPEVELIDSSGLDMTFDVCTAAKAANATLSLWLNGNQNISSISSEKGPRLEAPGWKLPHLAVIYCSDDDNSQRRATRVIARTFMSRHEIPTIFISQNPHFHQSTDQYIDIDRRLVHLCIESDEPSVVYKTFPIDLSTFLNLSPRQLNRNLGCVTKVSTPLPPDNSDKPTEDSPSYIRKFERAFNRYQDKLDALLDIAMANQIRSFFWLATMFGIYVLASSLQFWILKTDPSAVPPATVSDVDWIPLSHTPISTIAVAVPTTTSTVQVKATPTTDSSLFSFINSEPIIVVNDTDAERFVAYVPPRTNLIGIVPPSNFQKLRRQPQTWVRLYRDDVLIKSVVEPSPNGTLFVRMENAYEFWGTVDIQISVRTRPRFKSNVTIDLGRPWMRMNNQWRKFYDTQLKDIVDDGYSEIRKVANQAADEAKLLSAELDGQFKKEMALVSEMLGAGKERILNDVKKVTEFTEKLGKEGEYRRKARGQAKKIWSRRQPYAAGSKGKATNGKHKRV